MQGLPALAAHFFEDDVEWAAGLGGELLAHDVYGAEGAGFLAFFDEGADEGDADFFHEIAAACFSNRAELGVEDGGGLVDAFCGEGRSDAGGRGFAAEIGALAEVLGEDALLGGGGLGGISTLTQQGGDGVLMHDFGVGVAGEGFCGLLVNANAALEGGAGFLQKLGPSHPGLGILRAGAGGIFEGGGSAGGVAGFQKYARHGEVVCRGEECRGAAEAGGELAEFVVAHGFPCAGIEGDAGDEVLCGVAAAIEFPFVWSAHVSEPGVAAIAALTIEENGGESECLAGVGGEIRLVDADAAVFSDSGKGVGALGPKEATLFDAVFAVADRSERSAEDTNMERNVLLGPSGLGRCKEGIDDEGELVGREAPQIEEELATLVGIDPAAELFCWGWNVLGHEVGADLLVWPVGRQRGVVHHGDGDGKVGIFAPSRGMRLVDGAEVF